MSRLGFSGVFSSSFSYQRKGTKCCTRIESSQQLIKTDLKDLLKRCTIEQDDALKVLSRYDTETAFHFIDPPYVGSNMGHYSGMFSEENLLRLLELMTTLKGKFMMTMYPHEQIAFYAKANGWTIHTVERTVTASKNYRRKQEEWMITNY